MTTVEPVKLYLVDNKKISSIDIYESFYKTLAAVPYTTPVDIFITTNGGPASTCAKICYVIHNRPAKTRAFIKFNAHSSGTIIALSACELYITPDTTFSAVDAQYSPMSDLLRASVQKMPSLVKEPSLMLKTMTARAEYFREICHRYINKKLHNRESIMKHMHDDVVIHEQLFFKEDMDRIGIKYKLWSGHIQDIPKADTPKADVPKVDTPNVAAEQYWH